MSTLTIKNLDNLPILPAKKSDGENSTSPEKQPVPTSQELIRKIKDRNEEAEKTLQKLMELLDTMQQTNIATTRNAIQIGSLVREVTAHQSQMFKDTETLAHSIGAPGLDESTSITNGSLALAMAILLKLQQKYQEMQKLLTKVATDNLSKTPAIVAKLADATKLATEADAQNQRLDMWKNVASAGASLAGSGVSFLAQRRASQNMIEPETKLRDLQAIDTKLTEISKNPPQLNAGDVNNANNPEPQVANALNRLTHAGNLPTQEELADPQSQFHAALEIKASKGSDLNDLNKILYDDKNNQHRKIENANSTANSTVTFSNMAQNFASTAAGATTSGLSAGVMQDKAAQQSVNTSTSSAEQGITKTTDQTRQEADKERSAQDDITQSVMRMRQSGVNANSGR